jgi:hypothetical protein
MYVVGLAVLGLRRFLAAKCPHVIGRGGQYAAQGLLEMGVSTAILAWKGISNAG